MTNPFSGNMLREETTPQNPFAGNAVKPPAEPLGLGERAGAYISTALGPLARKFTAAQMGLLASGGSLSRARQAATTVEDEMVRRERQLAEEAPVSSLATGLVGGLGRYATMPGGLLGAGALGAVEAMASRPEESFAGAVDTGAEFLGFDTDLSATPTGRAAVDIALGIAPQAIAKGYRGVRRLLRGKAPPPMSPVEFRPGAGQVRGILPAMTPSTEQEIAEAGRAAVARQTREAEEALVEELAGEPPTTLALPRGPVLTPPDRPRLQSPSFPPESPRLRTQTVAEQEARAAAELAARQADEAARLDAQIAARQAADAEAEAARLAELEAEPSRFPRPEPTPPPAEFVGPVQAGRNREMEESLASLANAQWRRGRQRDAEQLTRRIADLDRLRADWDTMTPDQQRRFEVLTSYGESRRAMGLTPTIGGEMAEVVTPTAGKARKAFVRAETRAMRQLRAMEEWQSLTPDARNTVLRAMEEESLMTRMGFMQSQWRQAVQAMMNTPLNEVVIVNPQTGREVTVASALKRAKNHPARFEAEAYVRELQDEWDALTTGAPSRTPYVESRIGQRPTLRAAEEIPPIPKPLEQRQAERAAGRQAARPARGGGAPEAPDVTTQVPPAVDPFAREMPVPEGGAPPRFPETPTVKREQWTRNRPGFVTPQLAAAIARAGGGGLLGAAGGAALGETPEERLSFAIAGGLAGAGLGVGGPSIARRAAQGVRVNEALEDIAKRAKQAMKTPGMPGTDRFRTNAQGVLEALGMGSKRGTPTRPGVQSAEGVPLSRPTTVLPNEEPVLRRLNLSPEMQDIYGPRIAALAEGRQRQSWDQLADQAARLLNTKRETLARLDPRKMTGAEGLAIASLVRENTEELTRLAKSLDTIIDPIQRGAILDQMDQMDGQTNALLSTLMKGRTAQGQALAANRMLANLTSDPTYWFLKAQRVKGDDILSQVEKGEITRLLNLGPNGRDDLIKYLSSLRRSGIGEQIAQLRRAGLLTTLAGRVRDFVGTGFNIAVKPILRIPGAYADAVAANMVAKKVGDSASAYRTLLQPDVGEWKAMATGMRAGLNDMLESLGAEAIRRGDFRTLVEFVRAVEVDPSVLKRYDIPGQVNITMFEGLPGGEKVNALADFYQKYMMRVSGGTDRIFRAAAYKGAMQEQARLVATREGLKGPALQKRALDLLANPTDEMTANAQMLAEYATFTNDGTLARIISTLAEGGARSAERSPVPGGSAKLGALWRTGMNLIVPFRRTPANLISRIVEFTPGVGTAMAIKRATNWWGEVGKLALEAATPVGVSAVQRQAVQTAQRKMVETLTTNASGVGMIALGSYLYEQGVLTGESPRTGAEAEQWRTEGRQPNSILIGGQWWPVGQIAPLGNILSIAANYKQNAEEGMGALDRMGGFAGDALRTTLDQPLLTGPREALEAMTSDEEEREYYLRGLAGSFVPGGIAALARAGGVQREPQSMTESVMSRIPGLAEQVPARLDIFGQPVQKAEGIVMPTTPDVRQQDVVVWEMSDVGAKVGKLSKWEGEDPAQYRFRQEQGGQWLRSDLEALVESEYYQASTPAEKRDLIEGMADKSRRDFSAFIRDTYGIERPGKRD